MGHLSAFFRKKINLLVVNPYIVIIHLKRKLPGRVFRLPEREEQ
jgi:hypothetical protein